MPVIRLALKSLWNRRLTALLTLLAISLSVTLLLGVEKLRNESRSSFANTISGTDLIVGARSGSTQLLLYSVFRIGDATNNISWKSYQELAAHPKVKWSIPISLGDSHRGFRVMGTTEDYFKYFRYQQKRSLQFESGNVFNQLYHAVLGADVAKELGYTLGKEIIIAHGGGKVSFVKHDDKPFSVVGILEKTGTPVDRTIHVSLQAIEAIHVDWQGGVKLPGFSLSAEQAAAMQLQPKSITAFMLGLKSRLSTFQMLREVNQYRKEPLLAIIPGVALQQLWDMIGIAEKALLAISAFVVVVGLTGMVTVILTSLNERRREMAILRSVGARPLHIFGLVLGEAVLLTLIGCGLGLLLLYGLLLLAQPLIETQLGLFISINWPSTYELQLLLAVIVSGIFVSLLPAYRAYRYSLADGMNIRI